MNDKSSVSSSHVHENCRCDYSYMRKKGPKFQGQTTTNAYYKPYPIEKQPVFQAPKVKTKHYDPEALQTSYKMQYVKPQMQKQQAFSTSGANDFKQSYLASKSKAPFYSETQYKKSFQPKQIKVQKQPVYQYKPKQSKFEGQSSYKQQYTAKKNTELLNPGQQLISAQKMYQQKPKLKFQGQSSYKSQFQPLDVKVQKQPDYKYQPKNTKFQGQSSYKATYTKLPESAYKSDIEYCPEHPGRVAIK